MSHVHTPVQVNMSCVNVRTLPLAPEHATLPDAAESRWRRTW
jgi:hypothetical protein